MLATYAKGCLVDCLPLEIRLRGRRKIRIGGYVKVSAFGGIDGLIDHSSRQRTPH
jgi:hypothetical protein